MTPSPSSYFLPPCTWRARRLVCCLALLAGAVAVERRQTPGNISLVQEVAPPRNSSAKAHQLQGRHAHRKKNSTQGIVAEALPTGGLGNQSSAHSHANHSLASEAAARFGKGSKRLRETASSRPERDAGSAESRRVAEVVESHGNLSGSLNWSIELVDSEHYVIHPGVHHEPGVASGHTAQEAPIHVGDLRLTAFRFSETCGVGQNEDWCKHGHTVAARCSVRVSISTDVCQSGIAVLANVFREEEQHHRLMVKGCPVSVLAQYGCLEDTIRSVLSAAIMTRPWETPASIWASRHHHLSIPANRRSPGVSSFFGSAVGLEWGIFAAALPAFFLAHWKLSSWPLEVRDRAGALLVWVGIALAYNGIVFTRLGTELGTMWLTGYALEFIFSIENVFVFHIVVSAFHTPQRQTQKGVFIVACCQIIFQMVFYMGLANPVRHLQFLPYVLGLWLLYVGVEAARESGHGSIEIQDTCAFNAFKACLRGRLSEKYQPDGSVFFRKADGRLYCSLLAPVMCCLLIVDFLLEIDVTLTKIEELPNAYISFTSSVVATFALPDLSLVSRALFLRFRYLKYGISFVLVFFGLQMLGQDFVAIPDLISVSIMICVMGLCILLSHWIPGKANELGLKVRYSLDSLEDGVESTDDADQSDSSQKSTEAAEPASRRLSKSSSPSSPFSSEFRRRLMEADSTSSLNFISEQSQPQDWYPGGSVSEMPTAWGLCQTAEEESEAGEVTDRQQADTATHSSA